MVAVVEIDVGEPDDGADQRVDIARPGTPERTEKCRAAKLAQHLAGILGGHGKQPQRDVPDVITKIFFSFFHFFIN